MSPVRVMGLDCQNAGPAPGHGGGGLVPGWRGTQRWERLPLGGVAASVSACSWVISPAASERSM